MKSSGHGAVLLSRLTQAQIRISLYVELTLTMRDEHFVREKTGCLLVMESLGKSQNLARPFSRPGNSWKLATVMESHAK